MNPKVGQHFQKPGIACLPITYYAYARPVRTVPVLGESSGKTGVYHSPVTPVLGPVTSWCHYEPPLLRKTG